jgi:hypothetical protein
MIITHFMPFVLMYRYRSPYSHVMWAQMQVRIIYVKRRV